MTQQQVVVGVDGSSSASDAAWWAAAEAQRRGATLRLVQAFPWPQDGRTAARPSRDAYRTSMQERSQRELDDAARLVTLEFPELKISAELVVGHPIPVLAEATRDAALLVLGDRGLGGLGGLLLGSVAVSMAAHAPCPVVVVRGESRQEGPVVVGVDGSPTSEAAIEFAFAAADARGAPLVAVHSWRQLVAFPEIPDLNETQEDERRLLGQRLAGWTQQYPDVAVTESVVAGKAAAVLVSHTATAQLVVVGSRGRGDLGGLVLGSTSHALLHHSGCPVAVVRPV